jgi:hypothetical protein
VFLRAAIGGMLMYWERELAVEDGMGQWDEVVVVMVILVCADELAVGTEDMCGWGRAAAIRSARSKER